MARTNVLRAVPQLCDGCRMCELVCSIGKEGAVNPHLARIRVGRSEKDGSPRPIICRHCKVAQCQLVCPVPEAILLIESTGALAIDTSKCTGCMACVEACPFGAIWVGPTGEILKCDLCDGDPLCVKHCPYRPENSMPHLQWPRQSCLQYVERKR